MIKKRSLRGTNQKPANCLNMLCGCLRLAFLYMRLAYFATLAQKLQAMNDAIQERNDQNWIRDNGPFPYANVAAV